jgi:hypothetical protein
MGKQAANLFLSEGVSLNEGIAKLAGAHPDINQEQIKRICEFANTDVYLAKHDKNKTAGAESSYPQFQLADPARIIQDMSDGAHPKTVTETDRDYGKQPLKKEKVSSAKSDELLGEMFGMKEAKARADLDFSSATAIKEVTDAKDALIGLRDSLAGTGEQFDLSFKTAAADYYDTVKRHLLDGGGFEEVMAAARSSGASSEKIAEMMAPVVTRLLKEKVSTADILKAGMRNLEKVAHRVVNPEHPLVMVFQEVVALDHEIEKVASGLEQVEGELKKVNGFIKERIVAGSAR